MRQLLVCGKNLAESIDMCMGTRGVKRGGFGVIINRIGDSTAADGVSSACAIANTGGS